MPIAATQCIADTEGLSAMCRVCKGDMCTCSSEKHRAEHPYDGRRCPSNLETEEKSERHNRSADGDDGGSNDMGNIKHIIVVGYSGLSLT